MRRPQMILPQNSAIRREVNGFHSTYEQRKHASCATTAQQIIQFDIFAISPRNSETLLERDTFCCYILSRPKSAQFFLLRIQFQPRYTLLTNFTSNLLLRSFGSNASLQLQAFLDQKLFSKPHSN